MAAKEMEQDGSRLTGIVLPGRESKKHPETFLQGRDNLPRFQKYFFVLSGRYIAGYLNIYRRASTL
jgi:hypothetical protein